MGETERGIYLSDMKFWITLIFVLVFATLAQSQDVTYVRSNEVKVECELTGLDMNGNPVTLDHVEWRLVRQDGQIFDFISPALVGIMKTILKRPHSGKYELKVRICGYDMSNDYGCSAYASSLNIEFAKLGSDPNSIPPVTPDMNYKPGTWEVYFQVFGPTGPLIVY